jgi:membrane-bound metal-dependent hydrolase YbcI (DUF457 family)
MPFTPIHMGPGLLIKSVLQGSFSLMVFGWTQIVMDVQPLIVMLSGAGHIHGFTHTYIGATLIALFSAVSGKYLSELSLKFIKLPASNGGKIFWRVSLLSAFIGSFSHVFLDSIMHADVEPFYPFSLMNELHHYVSVSTLHKFCLYSGLFGAVIYYFVLFHQKRK